MCGKAPFRFELGLEQFEACSSHVCVPSNRCNFDLRKEIEGFITTYVMTQKYNSALFLSSEAVCCPIVSSCKCASASCNPVYLHPLALCTRPRRTRTWREIRAGWTSHWWRESRLCTRHSIHSWTILPSFSISVFFLMSCETSTFCQYDVISLFTGLLLRSPPT